MEYTFEAQNSIGKYLLSGNLIGETDGIPLVESFSEQVENGTSNFIVDLKDLQHINSTGLGVLITLLTKARKTGGELVLVHPSDHIKNLLMITKLNTIFSVFHSTEEAEASFSA